MFLLNTIKLYLLNLKVAAAFLLLLVFVFPMLQFKQVFLTSANLFLDYNFINIDIITILPLIALAVLFLFVYSILITLMVFGVRRHLSKVKLHYYLTERIHKFSLKYFLFLLGFSIAITAFTSTLFVYSAPMVTVNFIVFLASLAFMFLAQSIVVDEASLPTAIKLNFEYIYHNFESFVYVLIAGILLTLVVIAIEFALDYFFLTGWFVAVVLSLLFVVPFLEVLKTQLYMHKFELIKATQKSLIMKQA